MKKVLVITSAQYVSLDMQSEFGRVPPVFLPLQGKFLLTNQLNSFKSKFDLIVLTLPEDFCLSKWQRKIVDEWSIRVVCMSASLQLGESICRSIDSIDLAPYHLTLLHGDTLFSSVKSSDDVDFVSAHKTNSVHEWSVLQDNQFRKVNVEFFSNPEEIVSGVFGFGSPDLLQQYIKRNEYNFIEALSEYNGKRPFVLVKKHLWWDFGSLQTYYQSKKNFSTERAFNCIKVNGPVLTKSSAQSHKMMAESRWFSDIPSECKVYTPQLYSVQKNGYSMEYLNLCTLSELFVLCKIPLLYWNQILRSCSNFLEACATHRPTNPVPVAHLYNGKVDDRIAAIRIAEIDTNSPVTVNGERLSSIENIVNELREKILPVKSDFVRIAHGDFCFSNILYDFRAQIIRTVDPRGYVVKGKPTIYSDFRYDIAKLMHSVIGYYDLIVAGAYDLEVVEQNVFNLNIYLGQVQRNVSLLFENWLERNFSADSDAIKAITVLHFLTMIPLHSEDKRRQIALFSNGLNLYNTFFQNGQA